MSLRNFTDEIRRTKLNMQTKGYRVLSLYVSPEGEKVILAGAMRETNDNVSLPELEIHSIPVKVHKSMPSGHVWYVFTGGLST